ncbi:MAG: DUF4258 domain-containing protein [Candidatus Aenigmarchaeota archaeon]|nr:DUF4258 domain-containing protein [Candidatus Aenigmarchaeota archaeon]
MKLEITKHARERMETYNVSDDLLISAVTNPDIIVDGYSNRRIYQKKLNGYILRVIVEENKDIKRIITVYKSRSGRYGI